MNQKTAILRLFKYVKLTTKGVAELVAKKKGFNSISDFLGTLTSEEKEFLKSTDIENLVEVAGGKDTQIDLRMDLSDNKNRNTWLTAYFKKVEDLVYGCDPKNYTFYESENGEIKHLFLETSTHINPKWDGSCLRKDQIPSKGSTSFTLEELKSL